MRRLLLIIAGLTLLGASDIKSANRADQKSQLKKRVSAGPFARLYSNTFYDLIGRIEEDGFMRESNDPLKGYDGMYPRTVGATVSLLLAVDRPEPAERLIRCVLNAMRYNGMDRIPHAFDKRRTGNPGITDRYIILGRGDQLDGQAHLIMAWARLANYRGRTAFEDSTYPAVAALLNSSFRPPYCHDTAGGKEGIDAKDGSQTGRIHGNLVYGRLFQIDAQGVGVEKVLGRVAAPANAVGIQGRGVRGHGKDSVL